MSKLARWRWTVLAGVLAGASCTNDYEQFDFSGTSRDGAAGQVGSAGTSQGTGGQLGSAPDGSITDSGGVAGSAAGSAGRGGASGDGAAGDARGGASGSGAQVGSGGQVGSDGGGASGTGGGCGEFEERCSGVCTDLRGRANCGACGNDCAQQGISASTRFECIDMRCGCTSTSQCGGRSASCSILAARCVCNGEQCQAGERCGMTSGDCTCNGGPACSQGQICCQDGGCRTSCAQ